MSAMAPGAVDSVLAPRAMRIALLLLTFYAAFRFCTQAQHHEDFSPVYPLVLLGACVRAGRARRRVEAWKAWRGSFDAMAESQADGAPSAPASTAGVTDPFAPPAATTSARGEPSAQAAPAAKPRRTGRTFMLVLIWAFTGGWLALFADEGARNPNYGWMSLGFGALTLWGTGAALVSAVRSLGRNPSSATSTRGGARREHIVSQCLPLPRSSPSPEAIAAALPAYCKELLIRSAAAASGNPQPAPSPSP
jgi:hypothetical protein